MVTKLKPVNPQVRMEPDLTAPGAFNNVGVQVCLNIEHLIRSAVHTRLRELIEGVYGQRGSHLAREAIKRQVKMWNASAIEKIKGGV